MHAASTSHRATLVNVVQALTLIAGHIQTQSDAARDIARLAARAEEIAAQAHALSATRYPASTAAADLARDFAAFLADANALAERASREAGASREIAETMGHHAAELSQAVQVLTGTDDLARIRAHLRPLAAALTDLPARMSASTATATDVAALGPRALGLADRSRGLHENARTPGIAAVAIYRELRDFAEAAAEVAETLFAEADRARGTITGMASQVSRLANPAPAPATVPDCATARLGDVVAQGAAAAPPPRRAPSPLTNSVSWTLSARR